MFCRYNGKLFGQFIFRLNRKEVFICVYVLRRNINLYDMWQVDFFLGFYYSYQRVYFPSFQTSTLKHATIVKKDIIASYRKLRIGNVP